MKKPYCCEARRALYEDYYTKQSGGELPVFYGAGTQRGYGIGSVLGGLFRRALPFLKSGAEILGKQALNVATDMINGKSFKESAKDRVKEGIKTFESQREAIQQSGSGVRRKRRHQSKKSNTKNKKRNIDISINMAFVHDQSLNVPSHSLTCFRYLPFRLA